MKKIVIFSIMLFSILLLVGCANKLPVTTDEFEFSEQIASISKSVVYMESRSISDKRIASGVVFKKINMGLTNQYFAVTSLSITELNTTIDVYLSSQQTVTGTVIKTSNDLELAVISFEATNNLTAATLSNVEDPADLLAREIFALGTPIQSSYYNMPTDPARVSKVDGSLIIHSTNLNNGMLGSPLILKSSGKIVGINVFYSTYENTRPISRINHALLINEVVEFIKGV